MEEYKRQVGVGQGMTAAVEIARQMLRQMEIADQDNQLPTMPPLEPPGKPRRKRAGKRS